IAARRCSHCGAAVRPLAKRTIEDKRVMLAEDSSEVASAAGAGDIRKASDPERKSPTIPDRSDMTIDFDALQQSGAVDVSGTPPADSGDRPTRRSTHTIERDKTIDFDDSS